MIKERADEGTLGWGKTGPKVFSVFFLLVLALLEKRKYVGLGRGG